MQKPEAYIFGTLQYIYMKSYLLHSMHIILFIFFTAYVYNSDMNKL